MTKSEIKISKRNVAIEEIEAVLSKISAGLVLATNLQCFLLCAECRKPVFYEELVKEFGLEVDFFSKTTMSEKLMSMLIGFPAIVKLKDNANLKEVFLRLSEQAMAVIYICDSEKIRDAINLMLINRQKADEALVADGCYFKYLIDEDSAKNGDDILEVLEYGMLFPQKFVESLDILA